MTWHKKYEPVRATKYAARAAAGCCVGNLSCTEPPVRRNRCERHLAERVANERRAGKRRYMKRKLAGLCVTPGCPRNAQDDCVLCWACVGSEWRRRKPAEARRARNRWRKAKRKAGLCERCGSEPLESKRYCETCLIRARDVARAHYLRKHPGAKTRERAAVRGLEITPYALARNEVAA